MPASISANIVRWFRGLSLRTTISASIFAVVLLTLAFGTALTYWHAQGKVAEEMRAAFAVGTRIAAKAVDDLGEWSNPQKSLAAVVGDFHGDRHLKAKWTTADGTTLMSSVPLAPTADVPVWFENLVRRRELEAEVPLPSPFAGTGRLMLQTDSTNEIGEVWEDSLNTLMILAVFSGLVLLSTNLLLAWALKPLSKLTEAFGRMSPDHAPPRVPETGPQDLVQVYEGFNAMAERLARIEAKNRSLDEQLLTVAEEERADLARDLHDEIGPFLFSADVDAASIVTLLEQDRSCDVPGRVAAVRQSIRHMQQHVRDLLQRLRSGAMVEAGLEDAVDHLVAFWQQRYPNIDFDVGLLDSSFGSEKDAAIYRVIQESLSNAIRHGQPTSISISVVDEGDWIAVEIANNGARLEPRSYADKAVDAIDADARGSALDANKNPLSEADAAGHASGPSTAVKIDNEPRRGFGIPGMRERVSALGGTLAVVDAEAGPGVVVRARLPAPRDTAVTANGPATSGPETSGPATSGPETSGPATSGPETSGPTTSYEATRTTRDGTLENPIEDDQHGERIAAPFAALATITGNPDRPSATGADHADTLAPNASVDEKETVNGQMRA